MDIRYNSTYHSSSIIKQLLALLVICVICSIQTIAQTAPKIVIGGDVYGGGLQGAVGTAPTSGDEVTADQANTQLTSVIVNSGQVRTVFGGGQNGKVYGKATVSIKGGEIGAEKWEGTPYGGVYGGGEGAGATVYGHTSVDIDGGTNYNNVYGGGKQALLKGNSNVALRSGLIHNSIFAGARMADINGYAFVDIIGNSTLNNMLIARAVYGGNDISGHILNNGNIKPFTSSVTSGLPTGLASFVRAQSSATNAFVANLFGGGNGDYEYLTGTDDNTLKVNLVEEQKANDIDEGTVTFDNLPNKPEAPYAYLQIEGGTYGSIYGGGNNATITNQTHIYYGINDATIKPLKGIPNSVLSWLDLYEGYKEGTVENTFDMTYNAFRIFGGNNLADMSIRPVWHLKSGTVGNIYSGGNKGKMTSPTGIVLAITSPDLKAHNVYGGCRMADVEPQGVSDIAGETYTYHSYKTPEGNDLVEKYNATYDFKKGYAARVLITDGKINNLYGGNDISGKVHFGTNVELRGAISGDVYGGGNGSYAYTDKESWVTAHPEDADYYYDPGTNSIEAMYANRPHVEKTLLHITGIGSTAPPVYVTGGVYCGGNSATLDKNGNRDEATATFEIGKHVVINSVFLGSNGENMIKDKILQKYADNNFSSLNLTDQGTFEKYMNAVAVNLKPTIDWEWNDNTEVPGMNGAGVINATESYIGAFYCGGNVGSMTTSEQMLMNFPKGLTIFDRIVGGCNSAKIIAQDGLNALHEGGVTTAMSDGSPKVVLNVHSRLEPRKMVLTYADGDTEKLFYETASTAINTEEYQYGTNKYSLLKGANVYGGCYESGHINGDVVININRDIVSPAIPEANMNLNNPEFLADAGITGTVPFAQYVFSRAMNIFGGGYGANTEIKGKTTINLTDNARVMKVFGGGEMGVVSGKDNGDGTKTGSIINITADKPSDASKFNAYMAYGGGYEGVVNGDITVNLNSGRLYDVYGGSCNADINGTTLVKIGNGTANVLEVKNSVFGANDFGGQLQQTKKWSIDDDSKTVRSQSHVQYLSGKIGNEVFGGAFGSYDYTKFSKDDATGFNFPKQDNVIAKETGDPDGIILANTFVQLSSQSLNAADNISGAVYGGGRGYANTTDIVDVNKTYVHLHALNARTTNLANTIFGGGYYSKVNITLVDAISGRVGTIYGGTAGLDAAAFTNYDISYNTDTTNVNLYDGISNQDMKVFGAGAFSGSTTTNVNLYGGVTGNIYGGSYAQGICQTTNVNVPASSTAEVGSLYGGSMGMTANMPCDVFQANIRINSPNLIVRDTIFGGNHAYRAVKQTYIDIPVPVRMKTGGEFVNVYAGGNGAETITGQTHFKLYNNGQVLDVYGGGKNGQVTKNYDGALASNVTSYYAQHSHPTWTLDTSNPNINNTFVELLGGELRNVYGGGYAGNVTGKTYLKIGAITDASPTHANGIPTIQRSAYGGCEMAEVTDTAKVDMFNGYVGYYYNSTNGRYIKNLDFRKEGDKLLKENGNLYGAGYGEGAVVMSSKVNLHGGVIRNGLYGGGEIAPVGKGTVKFENEKYVLDQFTAGGKTEVRMYGGLVEGDVFGGGRGFSYDLTGNLVAGKINYTDGYVFGKTDVELYRGVIGTDASLKEGHGNVFGGGNIGYVYGGSATGKSLRYTGETDATNAKYNGHYYTDNTYTTRSEDTRVHITAMCKVIADDGVTIDGTFYAKGKYVPTAKLNKLTATASEWSNLDTEGLTIRNAVFAGGNVSSGSDKIYANAVTVYGNSTAAVVDVFSKDFILLGDDGVGGIYGDGNLTFVDGYRELNITNYGTDYYNMTANLTYAEYLNLSDREKGFYDLLYSPKDGQTISFVFDNVAYLYRPKNGETPADEIDEHTYKTMLNAWIQKQSIEMEGKWTVSEGEFIPNETVTFTLGSITYTYSQNTPISATAYDEMMANYKTYEREQMAAKWNINGECSLTAGRMMNTIQRADFCGMFGSRIMLYGAQDRVPDIVDYTKYTINRVGEVSLNKSQSAYDATIHGNYFGIYNVVNYLGALTSDVEFEDIRKADGYIDDNVRADGTTNYYNFKKTHLNERIRNMASSQNMVAQASGVFLELVKSKDQNGKKTYGPVTGVIQLDIIDVKPGEGGGYVYAENIHGKPNELADDKKDLQTLSDANEGAITHANYTYSSTLEYMQTSGNFVHPTKRIVDDCFPNGGYYDKTNDGDKYSSAHYWYIRGDYYVYDQYLSAYTGAVQAYTQDIDIPLTISAGSEGRMSLVSVNPNKYAYFVGKHYGDQVLEANDSILIEDKTYHLNDPISYWDWSQLSITDQSYFVDETYVAICAATIGSTDYAKGTVLLPDDYRQLATSATIVDKYGESKVARTDSVFRISNELSHKAGYLLTFDISNPLEWDDYYTKHVRGTQLESILESAYREGIQGSTITAAEWKEAPTLLCNQSGIYGQRRYAQDELVSKSVIDGQKTISESTNSAIQSAYAAIADSQAVFKPAYVVTAEELSFTHGGKDYHMFEGSYIDESMYDALDATIKNSFKKAYICINTIEVEDKIYILNGDLIPESRYNELNEATSNSANSFMHNKEIERYFSPAYVCTKKGKYGGAYFENARNYGALDFCGLPAAERNALKQDNTTPVFNFNKDAFDLLSTDFHPNITNYGDIYSSTMPVNYTATYNDTTKPTKTIKKRNETGGYAGTLTETTITNGTIYQRADYEAILNEKSHYMPIVITAEDKNKPCYIVNTTFEKANIYFPVGKVITQEDYDMLSSEQKGKISPTTFTAEGTYYYCAETYKMSSEKESQNITDCLNSSNSYSGTGTTVPKGAIISKDKYNELPNYQTGFTIHGHSPIQTTTIYVPRESDILNLSKDRVITVVYKYDYKEGEENNITAYSEKHIINIHVEFRSGQPSIGDVTAPATVLPNSTVGLSVPSVTRGAYEILGGGWEMFETESDAREHKNGVPYKNNATPMYWYQNNYYVAYFAKTYLGKTYSNPVPFSVANYHRMGEVMNHEKRMFIDHKDVDRASKIYLDNASYPATSIAYNKGNKNDLDYLYDLYLETKNGKTSDNSYTFDTRINNSANLEFILRSDIAPKAYADNWQQPGVSDYCFAGNFHGNGHTVKGLNKSLFGNLCGTVYNTGVTGSFTGGGVADNGGTAVNCWVKTTGTPTPTTYAVIGNSAVDVINSYYDSANGFKDGGMAMPRPEVDFIKGKVAYDLNRYYLEARRGAASGDDAKKFNFYMRNADGTLQVASGETAPTLLESFYHTDNTLNAYAEDYFGSGDFVYANGTIPLENNVRFDLTTERHYPIYPDDYLFFGQSLDYTDATHDITPTAVVKDNNGLVVHEDAGGLTANRVYRAPAYRLSSSLNSANPAVYFNRDAAFAGTFNTKAIDVDLTAIDFTGNSTKETGLSVSYSPLLDFEELNGFATSGITQNLLVYADASNVDTYNVLQNTLVEPTISMDSNTNSVDEVNASTVNSVKGHLVDYNGTAYTASRSHFLVDKQSFNAPMAFQFANDNRMWYQRNPESYIGITDGKTSGWEAISLPFTAAMVTTNEKGDITHFYSSDDKAHEYWLRAAQGTVTEGGNTSIVFNRLTTSNGGHYQADYSTSNNSLYDKYYQYTDDNGDSNTNSGLSDRPAGDNLGGEQQGNHGNYYNSTRTYTNYLYLTAGIPYIIGFPGERYYEFDLSGNFTPDNSSATIERLQAQTISFISKENIEVPVSDVQTSGNQATINGYAYTATYQAQPQTGIYAINTVGNAFVPAMTTVPFRPYLHQTTSGAKEHKYIPIVNESTSIKETDANRSHGLRIYSKNRTIFVESYLETEATVEIYTTTGVLISSLRILPGEQRQVSVASGIYIVNQKKLSVK